MDVRLTAEQRQLREAAAEVADDLGPGSVADLDDATRVARLEKAIDGDGVSHPAQRRCVRRRGGHRRRGVRPGSGRCPVHRPGAWPTTWRAGSDGSRGCSPRSRRSISPEALPGVAESPAELAELSEEDAGRWHALALTATTADIVGSARGTLALATEYAKMREQYGATIGSYQAVGHLLAESLALIEGCVSVLRHAAWAVDELPVVEAVEAARVAKIYCARSALTVCETSIQVHGGIGNTWECLAHVYLRRVLAATEAWPVKAGGVDHWTFVIPRMRPRSGSGCAAG